MTTQEAKADAKATREAATLEPVKTQQESEETATALQEADAEATQPPKAEDKSARGRRNDLGRIKNIWPMKKELK